MLTDRNEDSSLGVILHFEFFGNLVGKANDALVLVKKIYNFDYKLQDLFVQRTCNRC